MSNDMTSMRLELIAAKAKQLSEDVKRGKLWEGDLSRGISEIHEQLSALKQEARNDR